MKRELLYSKPVFMSLCVILLFVFVPESFSQITPLSGRTPQVRDAIVEAVGKSEADITAEDLSEITDMRVEWHFKKLTSMRSVDLHNLPNLENVSIVGNHLTTLPEDIFSTNPNLQRIHLYRNKLTSLPDGIFNNFKGIGIRLDRNNLTELPSSIENMTGLNHLEFAKNPIENSWSLHKLRENNHFVVFDNEYPPPPPLYGRTQQIIDAIAGMVGKKPKHVTEADLASIDHVAVSDSNISSLQPHDFHGLTGVISVYLNRNNISSLPVDIFRDLTSLENLHLKDNNIGSLAAGLFYKTPKLAWLDLTGNNISTLLLDTFRYTNNMEMLQLSDNNIGSLPTGIFDNMRNLWWVELADNNISSLPTGIFDNNPDLVLIDLGQNNLTSLPANAFSNNNDLVHLSLDGNSIGNLNQLSAISSLEHLTISGNNITDYNTFRKLSARDPDLFIDIEIPEISEVLSGRTQVVQSAIVAAVGKSDDKITESDLQLVTAIDVSNNSIGRLKTKDFKGLTNLTHLNLSGCGLNRLEPGQFNDLAKLIDLNLSSNGLTARWLPDGIFDKNTKLQILQLGYNYIGGLHNDTLPADLFQYNEHLFHVTLNNNRIESLPKTLFDNTPLISLNVRNNRLKRIDCIENLTTLGYLYINGNLLTNAYAIWVRKEANHEFHVDYTDLATKLPKGAYALIGRTPQVQQVLLDRINADGRGWNKSDIDPLALGSIHTTAANPLDFSNKSITTLKANDFQWLWYVEHVNLSSNQLKTLPAGVFDELKALTVLNLSGNRLTSLDANIFAKNKELGWLVLANNKLTGVPLTIFDNNKKLALVDFQSNPIPKATQDKIVNKYINRINFIFNIRLSD